MFTFIINPASRSGLGRQVWERLEPVLDRRGISYKAYMTCCQRHATRLARELTADGREQTLVVLGGDGTLNEVVNGIQCFSGTTLGYIPVGSGMISPGFSTSPLTRKRPFHSYWTATRRMRT